MEKDKGSVQIKQIAESLGVSIGTVSFVLNGKGDKMRISEETQQKVFKRAREMHYQPNIYARRLRKAGEYNPAYVIAFFWEENYLGTLFGKFFKSVFETIERNGFPVEVCLKSFKSGELSNSVSFMNSNRFSGVIIGGASEKDEKELYEARLNIPVVLVNSDNELFSSVYVDSFEVGKKCSELFYGRGHRRVGIISSSFFTKADYLKGSGFIDGCKALNIEISKELISVEHGRDYKDGLEAMERFLKFSETPEAVFVVRSSMALGVLEACKRNNLSVPSDIEIMVYGEEDIFEYVSPKISSIHGSIEELAKNSVEILLSLLNNSSDEIIKRVMMPSFSFRESCGDFPERKA